MPLRLLAIASLLLPPVLLGAQAERITIQMTPAPNQTFHVHTTSDVTMTMTADAPGGAAVAIPPVALTMTMSADYTSTVGPTDAQGRYEAHVICDGATVTAAMNGQPMPMGSAGSRLVGQEIAFAYDEHGKPVDIAVKGSNAIAGPLKQALTSAMGAAPPMTLSVGESTTVPTAFELPLPSGTPGGAMTMKGAARYTLTSVTFEGADRIAHLAVTTNGTLALDPRADGAKPTTGFDMTAAGTGTTDVNVDRGIVVRTEMQTSVDGTVRVGNAGAAVPPMTMHGTTKTSATLSK